MSTKSKTTSYSSNELTAEQKRNYKRSLVRSQENIWYLFESELQAGIRIMNPRAIYKSWDDFSNVITIEELTTLHVTCFDKQPTKQELKDKVELSVKVWMRLCETALNRLEEGDGTVKAPGERKTAAKLQNRGYEVLKTKVPDDLKLPPQAKTCMEFFAELVSTAPASQDSIVTIPETQFKDYVMANAARLNTRQDPWRIFQYYRAVLISSGFIRLV